MGTKEIVLKQEDFLYYLMWDEKVDALFAEVLYDQAHLGTFSVHGEKTDAIATAQYVVNKLCGTSFGHNFCVAKVRKLRKRHQVFSWLIRLEGVNYDKSRNRVQASPALWISILQVNPFAQAYEPYGDPAWEWLKVLFGDPPMGPSTLGEAREDQPVINLSSDDERKCAPVRNKGKSEIINIDISGDTSSFNRYATELGVPPDDSDSDTSPSVNTELSIPNTVGGLSTPTKGPPPSWVGVSPWKK